MARGIVVLTLPITVFWLAIGNECMAARKAIEQSARFRREWVLPAIASTVTPPDFSR
jgi:hypothetical protein